MHNKTHIIAGKWRNSALNFSADNVRPTHRRIRETLFNWIHSDIIGSRCLDLFSGSGSLGFEALSRGASWVDFVEKRKSMVQFLKKSKLKLGDKQSCIYHQEALNYLSKKKDQDNAYDLVFLDPPYDSALLLDSLELIDTLSWLKKDSSLIYVEYARESIQLNEEKWRFLKVKHTKTITYALIQRNEGELDYEDSYVSRDF